MTSRILCIVAMVGLALGPVAGAEYRVRVTDQPPPSELDAAIRARLQSRAVQVLAGDEPVYEFWLATDLALASRPESPAKALDAVPTAALLGAVKVPKARRDYRDDEVAAGVHTMRLAVQQQDGNHLGTAEFLWFAVLVPAKLDLRPDGIKDYKGLMKASSKETSTDHPVVLSLRPAAESPAQPSLHTPAPDHRSVRVAIPAQLTGSPGKSSVAFEIVFEGIGHK